MFDSTEAYMVRSLAIRQIFVLLDLALTILIVFTVGMVVMQVLEPPPLVTAFMENSENSPGRNVELAARIGDRSQYDRILAGALFGEAGRWEPGAEPPPPPPPPPSTDLEDTQLNLRLLGTVALSPKDPFASAIIENADLRTKGGYGLGQEVVEKVKLLEVYPREVVLLNERNTPPTRERLRMDEEDMLPPAPKQTRQAAMPVRSGPIEQITLDRMDMVNEIMRSYSDLVTKVKPEPYRDADGRIIGLTASNISQIPLAGKLGLTDNDVLQTVNNEPIDSMEKIYDIFNKYGNANSIRIGILRDGKPKIITYNFY